MCDWLYRDGEYILDPLEYEEPAVLTDAERDDILAQLMLEVSLLELGMDPLDEEMEVN